MILHKWVLSACVVLSLLLFVSGTVRAECCGGASCPGCVCADGSSCGCFSCCGVGGCNIFCCNCDGGCRQPTPQGCKANCESQYGVCETGCDLSCNAAGDCEACYESCDIAKSQCDAACPASSKALKVDVNPLEGLARFANVDTNQDGSISPSEVQAYLAARGAGSNCSVNGLSGSEQFAKLDADQDGRLTLSEADLTAAQALPNQIQAITKAKSPNAAYYQKVLEADQKPGSD